MKTDRVLRSVYVLPCCLLLLNLCVELVSYKARMFSSLYARTGIIMAMVLFGGSFVAFLATPAIEIMVNTLHKGSRKGGGVWGEVAFLVLLGLAIFWLYYQVYNVGPEAVLPAAWHNR